MYLFSRPVTHRVTARLRCLILLFAIVLPLLILPASYANKTSIAAIKSIRPEQLEGTWYEIGLIPYFFENSCIKNPVVKYTLLPEEKITTFIDYFECRKESGNLQVNVGRLRSKNAPHHSIYSATFLNLFGWRFWFGKNYWVMDLSEEGNAIVVGHPDQKLAWLMARTPTVKPSTVAKALQVMKTNGYKNSCDFILMPNDHTQYQNKIGACEYLEEAS